MPVSRDGPLRQPALRFLPPKKILEILFHPQKTSATIPASMEAGMLDGSAEIDRLRRIVALLFALAVLAQRAGAASPPVRRSVLCILWRAEAVAWQFVAGAAPVSLAGSTAGTPALPDVRDDPDCARRLAMRFRALALVLACLSAGMRDFSRARRVLGSERLGAPARSSRRKRAARMPATRRRGRMPDCTAMKSCRRRCASRANWDWARPCSRRRRGRSSGRAWAARSRARPGSRRNRPACAGTARRGRAPAG